MLSFKLNRKHFINTPLKNIFLLCFCSICLSVHAADTLTVSRLLNRILSLSINNNHDDIVGILPSFINDVSRYSEQKKDCTIFYNLITAQILQQYSSKLSEQDQQKADSFIQTTKNCLPHFQNNSGRPTWNFWRTDTIFTFPYSWWIPALRGNITLPDDMDDTVLTIPLLQTDDSTAIAVHQLMQRYTNQKKLQTTNTAYHEFKAYSAWFGKKFPVVFDVSVLCNILQFVHNYQLPMSSADTASIQFIIQTIQRKDYKKRPAFISPYYPEEAIVIYHYSKLLQTHGYNDLEPFRKLLIDAAIGLFNQTNNKLEQLILSNAIMKMGGQSPILYSFSEAVINEIEKNDFSFFTGNIPSYFQHTLKSISNSLHLLQYRHYCPAWNDALLIENILLREN